MPNKLYVANDTAIKKINGEAGADTAWSIEGVANGAGRISAQVDLGAPSRAFIVNWVAETQWQATPTLGSRLRLYISEALDGANTDVPGDLGVADAAVSDEDELQNLRYIGGIVSENAAASEVCSVAGTFITYHRYFSLVGWNAAGAAINATDSNSFFKYTVQALEVQ